MTGSARVMVRPLHRYGVRQKENRTGLGGWGLYASNPQDRNFVAVTFDRMVARQGDADFIVYPDRNLRWSYRSFSERVDRLAKGLLAIGVGRGDHVGIWARNVPDWLTFLFAIAKIGAVLVTMHTAYKSHELGHVVRQSVRKALVLIDGFRDVN